MCSVYMSNSSVIVFVINIESIITFKNRNVAFRGQHSDLNGELVLSCKPAYRVETVLDRCW